MQAPTERGGLPDAANPRAVAYAHRQLKRMVTMGLLPKMPSGLPGEDVTATYRRVSSALGANKQRIAAEGAGPGGYQPAPVVDPGFNVNPGGPMQPAPAPAAMNPLDAAAMAQAQPPQMPAAAGPMEGAALDHFTLPQLPAAAGVMQHAPLPRTPGQHPHEAAIQALMAAIRPQQHGPVNARQQLIAHLAQRIRAQQTPQQHAIQAAQPHATVGQPGAWY